MCLIGKLLNIMNRLLAGLDSRVAILPAAMYADSTLELILAPHILAEPSTGKNNVFQLASVSSTVLRR